jgi:ADP-ribosylglycohydrolase/fructose-1,6-bisphosphatase/inositol monophosphatase family enzyme
VIPHPQTILPAVIEAAAIAGRMVAEEFSLPGGPRLIDHITAPIDHEIELLLRARLMELVPARFVGEEAGIVTAAANGLCWVVDPHDGTRAFLEGKRGSAVSIALLQQGQPVLAVVFAPLCPDRGPDMIAWAEGGPITRNGAVVAIDLSTRELAERDVIFLNHGVWQRPVWNSNACAPARFMPLPSIAYRLARIAVGDGIATQTLRPVNAVDIAAGHALLLAAGGVLVAEDGQPVTYSELGESRPSACFGGAPRVVATLLTRAWRGSTEPRREPRVTLGWPRAAEGPALDRAAGCLLGLAIGDALGAQVETLTAAAIAATHPDGVRHLDDSAIWRTLAGQPTDDTELALALARSLIGRATYDAETAAAAYGAWFATDPFHAEPTTARAFAAAASTDAGLKAAAAARAAADPDSRSNGALMRVAPIGIWAGDPTRAAKAAREDCALSHPHPTCQAACAALAAAIAAGIGGADRAGMLAAALHAAHGVADGEAVVTTLEQARAGLPETDVHTDTGSALTALGNAFGHLATGTDAESALIRTVAAGGDTNTNAAITGALFGAADGRLAFPVRWVMPVLTCRPDAGLAIARPRPDIYWTDDLIDLAEALLTERENA